jgi:hypothetical protein
VIQSKGFWSSGKDSRKGSKDSGKCREIRRGMGIVREGEERLEGNRESPYNSVNICITTHL